MKDLTLKNEIVSQKIDKISRRLSWLSFKNFLTKEEYQELILLSHTMSNYDNNINRVCHNLNNSRYYRIKKCKDFINRYIFLASQTFDLKVLFLTFTFSDETLKITNERSRRRRINTILKNNCLSYIANIDFGKKTEREHYHAIALMKYNYDLSKYEKNGFFTAENVNLGDKDSECIAKYINKLTYHAIKDTTQHDNSSYRCVYYTTFKN